MGKILITTTVIVFLASSIVNPVLADFTDVSETHSNNEAIQYVTTQNIVNGYSDNTFRADNNINRAEFIKIIVGAQYEQETIDNCISQNSQPHWSYIFFPDASIDAWYAPYICVAKTKNIVNGYSDGNYHPSANINLAEAAKIISNAFGYSVESDPIWYKPFLEKLSGKKVISTSIASFEQNITRGETVEMIYRLRENITNQDYMNYSQEQLQVETVNLFESLLSQDCEGQCVALIFVEQNIQSDLQNSLDTWEQDVAEEFGAKVKIIPVAQDTAPERIKEIMWDYEDNPDEDVFVTLLVGEIPYFLSYISNDNDEDIVVQAPFPSDILFLDDKDRCAYNSSVGAYNSQVSFGCQYQIDAWPFVVGRLKPSGDTATRISLLKKYFERNHQHRILSNSYGSGDGKLLVNITDFDGTADGNELISTEAKRLEWLLPSSQYKIISPLTDSNDQTYLAELQKNYSAVYFNGQGSSQSHQYNITPEVIQDNSPQGLYYSFQSGSIGDIATADNIASTYLFSGEGLFVYSNSIPVSADHSIGEDIYYLMSGVPIYKYYSKMINGNYTSATILMGDPTISIKKANTSPLPDLEINPPKLDFGKISLTEFTDNFWTKEFDFSVKNNSSQPIYMDEGNMFPQFFGDSYDSSEAIQIIPRLKYKTTISDTNEPFSTTSGAKVAQKTRADGTILLSLEKDQILASTNPYKKFAGQLVMPIYSAETDQIYILDIPFTGEIIE